jgi:ribosome-binding factor A
MLYKRADRVADLIREVISEMLLRDLNDPRLESLTITEVEMTADLKLATVFFSAMGNHLKEEEALVGLQSATGFIRKRLGKELRLRHIPDLLFKVDHSFDYGSKIDRLIQTIKEEKDRNFTEDR